MSLLSSVQSGAVEKVIADQQQYLDPVRQFILDHFGQNGLYAAYALSAILAGLLLYKLVKFSFELIFLVAVPSTLAAFILSYFLPYNFLYLLPITTALLTLGLVIRVVGLSKG